MSSRNETARPRLEAAKYRLERLMEEVAEYRQDLLQMRQASMSDGDKSLRGFQSVLMAYYMELDLYRDEGKVKDFWENAKLWQSDGEWVCGFGNLEYWNNATRDVETNQPGLGRGRNKATVPDYMPLNVAIQVSRQLDRAAKKLGLAIPIEQDASRPYDDWREEFEGGVYHGPDDVELPHQDA